VWKLLVMLLELLAWCLLPQGWQWEEDLQKLQQGWRMVVLLRRVQPAH
jgi:hypothetical protein